MFDFDGHTAIVTGAATGIGRAIATCLAESGAAVALVDVDEDGVNETAGELRSRGSKVAAIRADVSSRADVDRAVAGAEAALGDITLLVNNAGIAVIKSYLDHSDADLDRQLDVNLRGTHYFMSAVIPGMVARQAGAVVNIASVAALHYTAPHAGYAASKAAIIALSRDIAFEVARDGVRVNCVAPGLIAVPPSKTKQPYLQAQTSGAKRDIHARTSTRPLGYGAPEDIANAVAFLLSDQARFIVGQTLSVAGGTDLQISMAYPGT
jgi:NAD(P)-dependent dehydrogenase (short-subunit alcohol dehydrogenase family)